MTCFTIKIVGFTYIFVGIVVCSAVPSTKLPKGFIQCKKSDKKFDECLRNAIQVSLPHLANGVPSLGINKIDPLTISKLEIDQGTGPVSIKMIFKDLNIHNIKHAIIDKAHYDPVKYNLVMDLHNPQTLMLEGDYEISGKVLILPIVGKGKCKISLNLSKILGNVQLKPVVKNGITYLEIVKLSWSFTTTKLALKFDNLFNGDKALGHSMNVLINDNWREIMIELQPAIEGVFGTAFTEMGQQFLIRVPLNQLLLD